MACAIAVMAKAPQPGRCKTRLAPLLGAEWAADLSAAFLCDITENLRLASEIVPIVPHLAYAPAGSEPLFDGLVAPGTRLILADGSGEGFDGVEGFGRSLLHAIDTMFAAGYGAACVLNSDSPTLPNAYLRRAAELLHMPGDRVVLGPAEDGGYYLLGMKRRHATLFADVSWSTEHVAAQTRERARDAGLPLLELGSWYDVDGAEALERLRAELAAPDASRYMAPVTAECLRAFDAQAA
jgi:rSAM/selenodomain-associated transferase 1